jgi:hypothetical protein
MTPEEQAVETAIAAFRSETRKRLRFLVGAGVLVPASLSSGAVGLFQQIIGHSGGLVWLLICMVGILTAAVLIARNGRSEQHAIPPLIDARAVGALIEMRGVSVGAEKREVDVLLIAALNELQPTDGALLTRSHRSVLNEALRLPEFDRNAELLVAVLHAHSQVGDETSLAAIEDLARHQGEAGSERRVREAARNCLAELRPRLERQRPGKQLLRASGAALAPEILLRAAEAIGPRSQPSEMLRPVDTPPL